MWRARARDSPREMLVAPPQRPQPPGLWWRPDYAAQCKCGSTLRRAGLHTNWRTKSMQSSCRSYSGTSRSGAVSLAPSLQFAWQRDAAHCNELTPQP